MASIRPDSGKCLELRRKRSSVTSKTVSGPSHTSSGPRVRQQNTRVTIDLESDDEDDDCLLLSPRSSAAVRGESSSKRTRIPETLNLLGRQALSNEHRRNEPKRHGVKSEMVGSNFLGLRPPTVDLTSPSFTPSDDCQFLSEFPGNPKRRRPNAPNDSTPPVNTPVQQSTPETPKAASLMCVVCRDVMKDSSSTVCGHVFCKECIMDAIKAQKKCPICRKKLSSKQVYRIYLSSAVV